MLGDFFSFIGWKDEGEGEGKGRESDSVFLVLACDG